MRTYFVMLLFSLLLSSSRHQGARTGTVLLLQEIILLVLLSSYLKETCCMALPFQFCLRVIQKAPSSMVMNLYSFVFVSCICSRYTVSSSVAAVFLLLLLCTHSYPVPVM